MSDQENKDAACDYCGIGPDDQWRGSEGHQSRRQAQANHPARGRRCVPVLG